MNKSLLITGVVFLLLGSTAFAQKGHTIKETAAPVTTLSKDQLANLPFDKGKWEIFTDIPNISYSHSAVKTNDISEGTQSRFAFNLGTNYYVANHIGIGLQLDAGFNSTKNNGKQSTDNWMAWGNFTYGTPINEQLGFYARAGLGIGGSMDKYTPVSGNSTSNSTNTYGYHLCLGLPIQLEHKQPVYFTPEFSYRYLHDKFSNGTETDSRFGLGLKFETYLFCDEMDCDKELGYALSHHGYNQGHSYLGVTTRGLFDFGDNKFEYNNNVPSSKQTYNQIDLQANYMYYIVNNFALGAGIDFSNSVTKQGSNSNKQTNNGYGFKPMFEFNIPSDKPALNNLFIQGGYGFGMQKTEFNTGIGTNTSKYNTTDFCAGLGYNFFFHKGLSFTPVFQYDIATSKETNTGIKTKYTGPELAIGIRNFF